jgi:flagella basal body P-ring formation protein FlgA
MRTLLTLLGIALAVPGHAQLDGLLAPVVATTSSGTSLASPHTATLGASAASLLTAERLVSELEKELSTRFAVTGELKLTLARAWEPVRMPAEDLFLAVTELPAGGVAGAFFIRAKASSGGTVIGEWQLPLRAQLSQEVWVAATRLERGQEINRTLLGVQKVDVLRERAPLIPVTADPTAFDLTQSVPAGRPLTTRDVTPRPVIRKGQVVEVVAQQGLLAVSMKALALESGAVGDLIKLRNVESRREFSGQVLHESKVQVHF